MAEYSLETPLTNEDVEKLKAGDKVTLSGIVYTARDAAHKRLVRQGNRLCRPYDELQDGSIYSDSTRTGAQGDDRKR